MGKPAPPAVIPPEKRFIARPITFPSCVALLVPRWTRRTIRLTSEWIEFNRFDYITRCVSYSLALCYWILVNKIVATRLNRYQLLTGINVSAHPCATRIDLSND